MLLGSTLFYHVLLSVLLTVWVGGYLLRDECSLVASDACMVMNTGSPAVYDTQTQTLTNCLSD
jgi:hypothetical protein